jgi:hypothetical protein
LLEMGSKRKKPKVMKKFVYFLCSFFILSCERNSIDPLLEKEKEQKGQCVTVSYLTGICRQAVFKIEDPAFYGLGEQWNDHKNVFFTVLGCEIDEASLKGKVFKVTISTTDTSNRNCVVCQAALDYNGSKKYFVTLCE